MPVFGPVTSPFYLEFTELDDLFPGGDSMINLALSLLASALVYVGFYLWLKVWYQAMIPAALVVGLVYYFLSRATWDRVRVVIEDAMKYLEGLSSRRDIAQRPEQRNQIVDEAIRRLKVGYAYGKWQFMVHSQIDAQIGIVLYQMRNDINAALPYLEKSFQRNWIAQAMLAVVYMKKHNPDKMKNTFELAIRFNKKQPLLWGVFAYCLNKIKDTDGAIDVLNRGLAENKNNAALQENLTQLQNGKKMKMKEFGDQWYQFNLEKPQMQKVKTARFSRR
jgi:tetratricopeptide (TPR) repeat protein